MQGPVLVTGPGGFVGPHLLAELGGEYAVPTEADVTDLEAVGEAVRRARPVAVVHLAALSQVSASWDDPVEVWRVNALGTVAVLEAVRREQPEARVLVVSTAEVYGRTERVPTPEDEPPAPVSPYGASKAAAEAAAQQAARAGLDVVVARAFQHEGPGRDDRFAVGSWTLQIAAAEREGGGELLVGNLDVERDLTDVRDVCRAYRLLLDRSVAAGTYNIASGHATPLRRVVDTLVGLASVPVSVKVDPGRVRAADVPVVCGDASRLRAATGWEPSVALEQTLADTLAAARSALATGRMSAT